MTVSSMTGYGLATDEAGLSVEVRTVNHRYLDISCRLPRAWAPLEGEVKAEVGRCIQRGRVELSVRLEGSAREPDQELDRVRVERYLEWARTLPAAEGVARVVDVAQLFALPGVLISAETAPDLDAVRERLLPRVADACGAVAAMRRQEGEALARELGERLEGIATAVARLEARRPVAVGEARERLTARVRSLCTEVPVDEARIAQETAILADRSDVTEELIRLGSHLEQFRAAMGGEGPVGRTLDFLLVEMNREANTVGAKCQDAQMAREVVFIKGEIEKVREQVQNVE